MKTVRVHVQITPALRDRLRREARKIGVSMAELVRMRCESASCEEGQVIAELAAQLRQKVRVARSSLRNSVAEANAMLEELRTQRERRRPAEHP